MLNPAMPRHAFTASNLAIACGCVALLTRPVVHAIILANTPKNRVFAGGFSGSTRPCYGSFSLWSSSPNSSKTNGRTRLCTRPSQPPVYLVFQFIHACLRHVGQQSLSGKINASRGPLVGSAGLVPSHKPNGARKTARQGYSYVEPNYITLPLCADICAPSKIKPRTQAPQARKKIFSRSANWHCQLRPFGVSQNRAHARPARKRTSYPSTISCISFVYVLSTIFQSLWCSVILICTSSSPGSASALG